MLQAGAGFPFGGLAPATGNRLDKHTNIDLWRRWSVTTAVRQLLRTRDKGPQSFARSEEQRLAIEAQRQEAYAELPEGLEALQKELLAAKAASRALLSLVNNDSEALKLLWASESRLFGYLLLFDAAYRAVYDHLKVTYRRANGKPAPREMGIRMNDIVEDYTAGLAYLAVNSAPEPGPDLPVEARKRLEENRALFVNAAELLKGIDELTENTVRSIHQQAAKLEAGLDDHWLAPYGAP